MESHMTQKSSPASSLLLSSHPSCRRNYQCSVSSYSIVSDCPLGYSPGCQATHINSFAISRTMSDRITTATGLASHLYTSRVFLQHSQTRYLWAYLSLSYAFGASNPSWLASRHPLVSLTWYSSSMVTYHWASERSVDSGSRRSSMRWCPRGSLSHPKSCFYYSYHC